METTKNKPIKKIRYGAVVASIWANHSEKSTFYNVTLSRTYRDKATDEFRDTGSLSGTDLLVAAEALREAYRFIHQGEANTEA